MRIVHLDTERGWRGGQRQVLWLAQALARRGHESWVACRPGEPLSARAVAAGLPVFPSAPLFEMDPVAAFRLRGFLNRMGAGVLHAHTGHALGLGAMACAGTAVPLAATRRVDFPVKRNPLSRWKYRRADALAAISSRVREELSSAGVPAEKVRLIPSGIDPSGYPSSEDRDRFRRERGYATDVQMAVHVGALVPHKGQADLIRAARGVVDARPGVKFLLVGDGPLREELRALRDALGLGAQVEFLSHRPDALELTAMADVFVFPSIEEGLGTALLDALAIGVPTAATAAGGIPDIYRDPSGGDGGAPELSPPNDSGALARNILKVLSDPTEARRRVERGRERVKRFTVEAMADAYERLYRDLSKEARP